MAEADVVSRIQSGRGRTVEPGDPVFTFVDVAKLVDVVALGTTVNAEALHQDLNQLAARLITVRSEGERPDINEVRDALLRVEIAADRLMEALGGAEPDPALARTFDRESIQAVLRIRYAARRAMGGGGESGPHSQRQLTEWLISQMKTIYKSHFHVDAEDAGSAAGGKPSEPFIRFGRFVRDKLKVELSNKNIAT